MTGDTMVEQCPEGFRVYGFDVDGHTIAKCTGGKNGAPRKLCPHYGGKCPTIAYKKGVTP